MSTEELSMSMFASRADYDAAVRAQAEQLPDGLQLAVNELLKLAESNRNMGPLDQGTFFDRRAAALSAAADAIHAERTQRLTLQHHACDLARRAADLEAERDELRAKYDELLVALHGIGAALGISEGDRSPYSVTCGVLERVNRLAEIEAQEPVAPVETSGDQGAGIGWSRAAQPVGAKLYARPVPAQAVPDGWRLVPVDPTQEMLDAAVTDFERERHAVPLVMEVRRASWTRMIAAAPEHKA